MTDESQALPADQAPAVVEALKQEPQEAPVEQESAPADEPKQPDLDLLARIREVKGEHLKAQQDGDGAKVYELAEKLAELRREQQQ
jgi:hypothetical protein